jgi:hypothetical protein
MQGIVTEYVRLQTGRNYMCFKALRTPTAQAYQRHSMLFERPKMFFRIFIMYGLETPGRVATKSIAQI